MKLKIMIIIGSAIIGSGILIVVIQSRERAKQQQHQIKESQERVSTAMSNYTHTFKLNTNPPTWPEAQKK